MRPRTRGWVSLAAGVAAVGFGVLQCCVGAFLLLVHVLERTVEG